MKSIARFWTGPSNRTPAELRKASLQFRLFLRRSFTVSKLKRGPKVLVELNSMSSSHISYAYLANVIAEECGGSISPFRSRGLGWSSQLRIPGVLRRLVLSLMQFDNLALYRSFGARGLIYPSPTRRERREAEGLAVEFFAGRPDKRSVELFEVRGVRVGDLFYDSYLRTKRVPTLDPESKSVRNGLQVAIEEILAWHRVMQPGAVAAVLGSHAGYLGAIPLRVAMSKGIPAYEPTAKKIYLLTKERPIDGDFRDYPSIFSSFTRELKSEVRLAAKERLKRRFGGEVGVDMPYSTASGYTTPNKERLLAETDKPKILVAAHCFFDNPHCYGDNLFPDFWEWLQFLGNFSNTVDFDWYVKTHPDVLPGNMEILAQICGQFPRLKLLPSDSSHHQIIAEGINVALTVYGTIGLEYAYLGVPVINASLNNPHIMYGFNFHPKSISEYEKLLKSIPILPRGDFRDEVAEYYFMKNMFGNDNLFFEDWDMSLKTLGGYDGQLSPLLFREFLRGLTEERHQTIRFALRNFIQSKDHRLYFQRPVSEENNSKSSL